MLVLFTFCLFSAIVLDQRVAHSKTLIEQIEEICRSSFSGNDIIYCIHLALVNPPSVSPQEIPLTFTATTELRGVRDSLLYIKPKQSTHTCFVTYFSGDINRTTSIVSLPVLIIASPGQLTFGCNPNNFEEALQTLTIWNIGLGRVRKSLDDSYWQLLKQASDLGVFAHVCKKGGRGVKLVITGESIGKFARENGLEGCNFYPSYGAAIPLRSFRFPLDDYEVYSVYRDNKPYRGVRIDHKDSAILNIKNFLEECRSSGPQATCYIGFRNSFKEALGDYLQKENPCRKLLRSRCES